MSKFKVGDIVILHEFKNGKDGLHWNDNMMRPLVGVSAAIDEIDEERFYIKTN